MPRHNPCSRCGDTKQKGKKANAYVSWYVGDDRTTFYASWGVSCYIEEIKPIIDQQLANNHKPQGLCVVCGTETASDPEVVYVTLFLPKQQQADLEFSVCPTECWPMLRENLAKGARFIPERRRDTVGAQAQAPTDVDPWAGLAIGISS